MYVLFCENIIYDDSFSVEFRRFMTFFLFYLSDKNF